jgi:hypothetical protein
VLTTRFEAADAAEPTGPGGEATKVRAVQVDPIKPELKPPGTKRLILNIDILLSTSAFKIDLRRYTKAFYEEFYGVFWAGAYTSSHFSST